MFLSKDYLNMASQTMNSAGASSILGSSGAQSLANSMKINLYKLKYRIVYCSGKWNRINVIIYIRWGFRLPSDRASRQFTTVSWMAECKVLWVPTRNNRAIHKYRQIKANSISFSLGQDSLENWTVYFCTYWVTGNVTVNSSEPDCFQKIGLSITRFEWAFKFLGSWT